MNQIMNGVAVIDVSENETRGFFFDRELVDFARLNAAIRKNRKKAEDEQRVADQKRIKKEKADQKAHNRLIKWRVYTVKTFGSIIGRAAVVGGAIWTMMAELVNPLVAIPVAAFFLATACLKFGAWYGRAISRK